MKVPVVVQTEQGFEPVAVDLRAASTEFNVATKTRPIALYVEGEPSVLGEPQPGSTRVVLAGGLAFVLLLAVLEETLRDVSAPADGAWQKRLLELLRRARRALRARPALIDVLWRAGWELGDSSARRRSR